ncbi:MAG: hypothetical protein GXO80_05205 [Chlorobi bacterium]|nr:hypothetical protein [Chlorobiota bacterium]
MLKKFLIISLIAITSNSYSQIPVGKWRDHFSYRKAICLADAGEKIYVATENAVFSYDKTEGTIEKLTKITGYSDAEIQTIAYNKLNNVLIIAYKNSNIDILKNNIIYNLSEIKRKLLSTDKTIYNITFSGKDAYLSCGFGIVLIDTEKLEFKDTYFIGPNASYVKVNDIAFDETNIYAATDQGLFYAYFTNTDLADYRNWNLVPDIPNNNFKFNCTETFNGYLFANQTDASGENDTLYYRKNNVWKLFGNNINNLQSISTSNNKIILSERNKLKIFDVNLNLIKELNEYNLGTFSEIPVINYTIIDNDKLYIADSNKGLVSVFNKQITYIYPNGPYNNYTAKAFSAGNKLITTDGNNTATAWHRPTYNIFKNQEWKSNHIYVDTARNLFSIAVNPKDENNYFFGSWGYGVFEFEGNKWTASYNNLNSTLQPITGYPYGYIRIYGSAFDKNNNLWVTNQGTANPVSVKTEDNQWQSFNFGSTITNYYVEDIYVTENNFKWVELGQSNGILVFDDNNTPLNKNDDRYKIIKPTTSEGKLISSDVTAFSEDKDNNIWMGTGEGVVIYYNSDNAFEDDFYADRIQLTSYGKDTTEQYLLQTAEISDIETDGANRKWIATKNSGAFLVSQNGKEEILHFDKYNSPLISNSINDIAINGTTGEVFFLTDKGIMSYRSDATDAENVFGNVYVFPNPVRPGYEGKITVTGLASDVNVKFTDISGNVVYETTALGGQAVWNGKTFDGRKVNTGVYLIFCSNDDGSETFVTKLLFIN